jgi:2-C-methyl-D-erythritol 4-phosphate cytidylyltransferase
VERHGITKVKEIVEGGITRHESVARGFLYVSEDMDVVLTQDGVRPFLTHGMIDAVVESAARHGAATTAIRVRDTLKKVTGDVITGAVNRDEVMRIQTPQAFTRAVLMRAIHEANRSGFAGPDESSLAERIGAQVRVVEGSETNLKITTTEDLRIAEALVKAIY